MLETVHKTTPFERPLKQKGSQHSFVSKTRNMVKSCPAYVVTVLHKTSNFVTPVFMSWLLGQAVYVREFASC